MIAVSGEAIGHPTAVQPERGGAVGYRAWNDEKGRLFYEELETGETTWDLPGFLEPRSPLVFQLFWVGKFREGWIQTEPIHVWFVPFIDALQFVDLVMLDGAGKLFLLNPPFEPLCFIYTPNHFPNLHPLMEGRIFMAMGQEVL